MFENLVPAPRASRVQYRVPARGTACFALICAPPSPSTPPSHTFLTYIPPPGMGPPRVLPPPHTHPLHPPPRHGSPPGANPLTPLLTLSPP